MPAPNSNSKASSTVSAIAEPATYPLLRKLPKCLLRVVISWIVVSTEVFKSKRPNRRHLGYVFTGFCPVEMGRIAGQNHDASGRICFRRFGVELIAETDVENACTV